MRTDLDREDTQTLGAHYSYGCNEQSHHFCFLGDYDTDIMLHSEVLVDQFRTEIPEDDESGSR